MGFSRGREKGSSWEALSGVGVDGVGGIFLLFFIFWARVSRYTVQLRPLQMVFRAAVENSWRYAFVANFVSSSSAVEAPPFAGFRSAASTSAFLTSPKPSKCFAISVSVSTGLRIISSEGDAQTSIKRFLSIKLRFPPRLEAPKGHPSKGHRWKRKILVKF